VEGVVTERERIALAEEAESLPIHVRMCAMRHAQIMDRIADAEQKRDERFAAMKSGLDGLQDDIKAVKKAAWAILATLAGGGALTVAQIAPIMQALAGQ
jgi:hypothetical protein